MRQKRTICLFPVSVLLVTYRQTDQLPSRKQYCFIKFQTKVHTFILAELDLKVKELINSATY